MVPTLAALLLPAALGAAAVVPLKRATGELVEVTAGQESYRHEQGIAPDDAGAVHAFLRRLGGSRPEIVRVPGRKGTFLAADFCGGAGTDLERCLFLLQSHRGGEIRELARAGGGPQAHALDPVVFAGGGRAIVLARLGMESSRGVRVYEIAGASLRPVGTIDAGVPGELGEGDPIPFASVSLDRGQVVVRFDADLVLGTGQQGAAVASKPVVFREREDGFVRVEAPRDARGRR